MSVDRARTQRIYFILQIVGGFVAALVLGANYVLNALEDPAARGITPSGLLTIAALGYAAYFAWRLDRAVRGAGK